MENFSLLDSTVVFKCEIVWQVYFSDLYPSHHFYCYLSIFIFRLHLNASSLTTFLCMQHLSLLFPGSLPHCFLCSASELTSPTFQQLQSVFLIYPLSHSHSTAPVVPSSPSLQKFLSPLSPCPGGNSLLTGGCRNGAAGFSFRQEDWSPPSRTVWVFGCVLFVCLCDRQTACQCPTTHPWVIPECS